MTRSIVAAEADALRRRVGLDVVGQGVGGGDGGGEPVLDGAGPLPLALVEM
jgi:hypothetical protein